MKMTLSRIATTVATGATASMAVAFRALAQFADIPDPVGGGNTDLSEFITKVIKAVLNILGLVAVVVIIVAGIRLVVAGQEEGQREKARNAILYAIIGLIIIVLANVLVSFVVENLVG